MWAKNYMGENGVALIINELQLGTGRASSHLFVDIAFEAILMTG